MTLDIDTSNSEKVTVVLDDKKIVADARVEKSQKLLSVIDKELNARGKSLKDIKEIKVHIGPGSFTGLRVGTAVANTLGWALGIPVNGKNNLVEPRY